MCNFPFVHTSTCTYKNDCVKSVFSFVSFIAPNFVTPNRIGFDSVSARDGSKQCATIPLSVYDWKKKVIRDKIHREVHIDCSSAQRYVSKVYARPLFPITMVHLVNTVRHHELMTLITRRFLLRDQFTSSVNFASVRVGVNKNKADVAQPLRNDRLVHSARTMLDFAPRPCLPTLLCPEKIVIFIKRKIFHLQLLAQVFARRLIA